MTRLVIIVAVLGFAAIVAFSLLRGSTGGVGTSQRIDWLYQMPSEGAWARFDLKSTLRVPGEPEIQRTGTRTVRSIPQAAGDAPNCRWIEVDESIEQGGRITRIITKILLSDGLTRSDPASLVVRAWEKVAVQGETSGQARQLRETELKLKLPLLLPYPHSNLQPLPEKEILTGAGSLLCDGLSGTRTVEGSSLSYDYRMDLRRHRATPFGLVSGMLTGEGKGKPGYKYQVEFTLRETGMGAASSLPECR